MKKSSSIHTVTGYRKLSSRYFVQLTHLQSPNLNTHHATQTNDPATQKAGCPRRAGRRGQTRHSAIWWR